MKQTNKHIIKILKKDFPDYTDNPQKYLEEYKLMMKAFRKGRREGYSEGWNDMLVSFQQEFAGED